MPSFPLHSTPLNQFSVDAWRRTKNDQSKITPQKDATVVVLFSMAIAS